MTKPVITKMIETFANDLTRINHALKVFGFASSIAESEGLDHEAMEIVRISAILHDIGIKECERKYSTSSWACQEKEGPPFAGKILAELGIKEELIERVKFIIGNHHTYENIDGIDFQIIVEADFAVNAFEKGLSKDAIGEFVQKYFKTDTGKKIMQSMYLQ